MHTSNVYCRMTVMVESITHIYELGSSINPDYCIYAVFKLRAVI